MTVAEPMVVETIESMLTDHCTPERIGAAEGGIDSQLWKTLEEAGLTLVGVAESAGGSGGTLHDAAAIMKAAGRHGAPVPIAESITAACLAAAAGLSVPGSGPIAVLSGAGVGTRVAWGTTAAHALVVQGDGVALVERAALTAGDAGRNYAGEPWQVLHAGEVALTSVTDSSVTPGSARVALALSRALLMSGALDRAVELSVLYATEREQFGKPIGKQQILQHYLAEMAGEAVAAEAAADTAVDVIASGASPDDQTRAVAAAKAYAGRAVGIVNRLAHQLHGAIGFTDEHRLQYTTRRLWAWRDEHGSEAEWAAVLGASVAAAGGAALWPALSAWPPALIQVI